MTTNLQWHYEKEWGCLRTGVDETTISIYTTFAVDRHLGVCYVAIRHDGWADGNRTYFDDVFKAVVWCQEYIDNQQADPTYDPDPWGDKARMYRHKAADAHYWDATEQDIPYNPPDDW
jgi:hypothetical protein